MTNEFLFQKIKEKKSFLCVGLDVDLEKIPNVKRLTYLDVMKKFNLDSPSRYTIFNDIELPDGVIKTLEAREKGRTYEINLERLFRFNFIKNKIKFFMIKLRSFIYMFGSALLR